MPMRSLLLSGCAAGALTAGVHAQEVYRLQPGSFYEFGCHGTCLCPIVEHSALSGTFRLTRTPPDPLFEHFAVTDIQWSAPTHDITGGGTYRIGGEVAVQQEMVLDLVISGTDSHVDSGLVQVQAQRPNITITVHDSVPTPLCYYTVIHLIATQLPSHCSADFDNDGSTGTDADIEAFFACLAGNCCATCGSADFNGDGDTGTDGDIESFFRVLAGGAC
jgi:hypothetical protein